MSFHAGAQAWKDTILLRRHFASNHCGSSSVHLVPFDPVRGTPPIAVFVLGNGQSRLNLVISVTNKNLSADLTIHISISAGYFDKLRPTWSTTLVAGSKGL